MSFVLALIVLAVTQAPEAPGAPKAPEAPAARLAAAVDLPTPRERAAAARALAKDPSVDLDAWLAACRSFPPLPADDLSRPGIHEVTIPLSEASDGPTEGRLFLSVPPTYRVGTPAPLLIALHGTGGTGEHMLGLWRAHCDAFGLLLLCPSDPGPNQGFAGTEAERGAVFDALRWVRRRFDVDEDAVFLTGFSRGGHLTWDLGLRFPDRWAALVPMVGGPRIELGNGKANLRYLENLLHVPLIDLQGAKDQAGLVWSVREAFRLLAELDAPRARYLEFPDLGHDVDFDAVDWAECFGHRRAPIPRALVRRYARAGEGRSAWLECLAAGKSVEEVFVPKVTAAEAAALDDEGKRRVLIAAAEERTGRVEALFVAPGQVRLVATGVTKVRLLLPSEMLAEPAAGGRAAAFEVEVVGRSKKRSHPRPGAGVLLAEFVERFDRRFLPVAEVTVDTSR